MGEQPDHIAEQAIDWMVLTRSRRMSERQRHAMQMWLQQDPRHLSAWTRIQGMLGDVSTLRKSSVQHPNLAADARELLLQPRRRAVLRGLLAVAISGGSLTIVDRSTPLRTLTADLRTGTGQRRRFELPDGSNVHLNARSAADVSFNHSLRRLDLRAGELLAQVTADRRAFVVQTAQGRVQALGTRLCLRQEAESCVAAALHGRIKVITDSGESIQLQAGQAARFSNSLITLLDEPAEQLADWSHGRLTVLDVSLGEVIDRLRPYRSGFLRISSEAARLRVQGVFPLDDSQRALQALAETLPIRLRHYGPMTVIEASP